MAKLCEEFVLKSFKEDGSYLSESRDISPEKVCNETPQTIRESILNGNHKDVENTLKSLEEIEAFDKAFSNE
ncbi:hypothetical protein OQH61_08640 [Helicobacter sp. MIT 21-1697]|uniref:hypothetical protein n=1 Tax=Helicobacter sp. MIT 21-1697 TaxID=2993733 RepID=UPI00224A9C80|nr:hypothetical protein [Helicobacter sp. MIT 21-1697]MCX2717797.1 hypothetical protein [Helicobacter sp. MIT 21-1697]